MLDLDAAVGHRIHARLPGQAEGGPRPKHQFTEQETEMLENRAASSRFSTLASSH